MELKGKFLQLTKLSDDKFGGFHPNGINVGSRLIYGYNHDGIEQGKQLFLYPLENVADVPRAWTSKVVSFDEKTMTLKTKNSTYSVGVVKQEPTYKTTITTVSGKEVDAFHPTVDMIDIEDIAHSLSNQCRFGGHCPKHYSVAQHCVMVARKVKRHNKFEALLHDAAEYVWLDMPTPMKRQMKNYKRFETNFMKIIAKKFGFVLPLDPEIKQVDTLVMQTEREGLFSRDPKFKVWSHAKAKREFLKMFHQLNK